MRKLAIIIMFLSEVAVGSSYKDFICSGEAIPDTKVTLTPAVGAINSNMTASKNFTVTLTGDATIGATNIADGVGKTYFYEIKRDGLGAHVVNFDSNFILDNTIGVSGTGVEESLIPTMSNDSTPSPYVTDASSVYGNDSSNYGAWRAFEGTTNRWVAANGIPTGWIKVDMGSINFAYITKYQITTPITVAAGAKNWTFEASQDGTNWTILDTQSSITGWTANSPRVFGISTTTTPYRYLRLNITANNGGVYLEADVEFFGIKGPSPTTTDYFEFYNIGSKLILKNHWSSF